jgi:putative ABC transport system substrate-binding protein
MKRKIIGWLLATFLPGIISPIEAQQPAKRVHRIGVLLSEVPSSFDARNQAFREGLHELGYVEGKNIIIDYRYAEGKLDRLPELATELVQLKADVFLVGGTAAATAAKQATSTIPIVVGGAGDLVGAGLVASLAKPGGNLTGSTSISPDLSGKRLELLREVVPKASSVAVVWDSSPGQSPEVRSIETAARGIGVKLQPVELRDPKDFQNAYATMTKQQAGAVVIIQSSFTLGYRKHLVELAAKQRLPSICEQKEWTNDGCLMSYGPDLQYLWRRAAFFVDKILKGAKPADLPVEQPTKFEFVINLKTAKQIGLTIPPNVLARADKVIR